MDILSSEYVTPDGDTPTHRIWLCNLDLTSNRRIYVPTIYLYHTTSTPHAMDRDSSFFDVGKLKSALSKILVPFYPFAGELGYDDDAGRVEIRCTGRGVLFVEASCDSTMEEFGEFTPGPRVRSMFLPPQVTSPEAPCPLVLLQVNRFKCGNVCLGVAAHHMLGDGVSVLSFITAWTDVVRGVDPRTITRPFLDRSLLKARSPPSVQFHHTEYDYCTADDTPSPPKSLTVTSMFRLSETQLSKIKVGGCGLTTFTAVVAHTWKAACKARMLSPEQPTSVYVPADVRTRLEPPLPPGFLGNPILPIRAEATVEKVITGRIEEVGRRIEEAKKKSLNDGYLRSLMDLLEVERERIMKGRWQLGGGDLIVGNWMNLPLHVADFGWGEPAYVNRAEVRGGGAVYVMRDRKGGGVVVTVALEEETMPEFCKFFYEGI